jgi:hypothetical protein
VLIDLQYGLLAATQIDKFDDALKFLSFAADILRGRDLFCSEIKNHPLIAVEQNYINRLLEYLEEEEQHDLPSYYFSVAKALAERGEKLDLAEDLVRRGFAIIRQEIRRFKGHGGGFSFDSILDIGLFEANAHGLGPALENMERWQPQDDIPPISGSLTQYWSSKRGIEAFKVIKKVQINDSHLAYSLLGLLGSTDTQLSKKILQDISKKVLNFFKKGILDENKAKNFIPKIINNLLSQGMKNEMIQLLKYWQSPRILSSSYFRDTDIKIFLELKAIETVFYINSFNPDEFELDDKTNESEREREHRLKAIRTKMNYLFLPIQCKIKSISGFPKKEILEEIQNCLKSCTNEDVDRWWYEPPSYFVDMICYLLEAVIYLPTYEKDLVYKIRDESDRIMVSSFDRGYARYADILSKDERYYAQAEKLIMLRIEELSPSNYRASEIVQSLLSLYQIALRFNQELADNLFRKARTEASGLDGNIDDIALALTKTASRAQWEVNIKQEQLNKLATTSKYMKQVAFDKVNTRLGETLRLIAYVNTSFAFEFLKNLEQSNLIKLENGLGPITLGILDKQQIPANVLWPIVHTVNYSNVGIEVFKNVISQMLETEKKSDLPLDKFAKYIRTNVQKESREKEASKFIAWAQKNNLSNDPTVQSMQLFLKNIKELEIKTEDYSYTNQKTIPQKSPLFRKFLVSLETSPQSALGLLKKVKKDKIKKLNETEIEKIICVLMEDLPSDQIPDIISIIEIWVGDNDVYHALKLLGKITTKWNDSENILSSVRETLKRLLTTSAIQYRTLIYYGDKHLASMLNFQGKDFDARLKIMLTAIAQSLRELRSYTLYFLVGQIGALLSPTHACEVFNNLLNQFINKLPEEPIIEPKKEYEPFIALVKFMSDCLGHPRQAIRWRVMYALVDMIISKPKPVLDYLIAELQDEKHERWMTKREWIIFVLHHISLRIPSNLLPYAEVISGHALNKNFPHAKIRHHAKEILLNIEKFKPGTLK